MEIKEDNKEVANKIRESKIKYLSEYKIIAREYKQLKERYEGMTAKADNVKAQVISNMPVNNDSASDKMCDNICEMEKLENMIQRRMDKLYDALLSIESAINNLEESIFRTILSLRYIDGLRWENVAVESNFSWQHTHRLHNEALEKIEIPKKIKDESK
jgi:DNA-directed RNA polymerase specialized sigma subunit